MNRCAVNVGRLLEIRAEAGYRSIEDVDAIFSAIAQEVGKVPASQRIVTVTDWRRCPVMSAEAGERMVRAMTGINPRTERSGLIVTRDAPVAVLQFARMVRESKNPDRRMFFDEAELIAWLGEVLDEAERARLRAFMAHPASARDSTV